MPVVLKIIWILMIVQTFLSLFGVFTAAKNGYVIMGYSIYGLWAVNTMFFVNIILPVVLIVAMVRRFSWTWLYGTFVYLFMMINGIMSISVLDRVILEALEQVEPEVLDLIPNAYGMFHTAALIGVGIGALVDLFFMLMFIIKRRYFTSAA